MKQTRLESVIEVFMNYLSGFIVSYLVYVYVVFKIPVIYASPLYTASLFTLVSVIRSYLWRRFFNAGVHKVIHKMVIKLIRSKYE